MKHLKQMMNRKERKATKHQKLTLAIAMVFCALSATFSSSMAFSGNFFGEDSKGIKAARSEALKQVREPILYGPENPKATITIFTDMECGYCRKLHQEIPKLTELGIQTRYMAFPRRGFGSESYNKMVAIWCSSDKAEAMDRAMKGETIPIQECSNPVLEHQRLGQLWGIAGTPTILYSDGSMSVGYIPAAKIAREAVKHEL